MKTYKTAEVAAMIGIHPNTVRLYETLELIPRPARKENGYRVFTEFHIEQFRLARLAFQIEILQNGLRKKMIRMVKQSAQGEFDTALELTKEYLTQVKQERANAEEAVKIVNQILRGSAQEDRCLLKRREVSELLKISMDSLRNWEMNGLLTVRRKSNGYRVYTSEDISRLKVIRSLRCANYSLESILRMLNRLSADPGADIKKVLDTPKPDEDIIAVCDKLITSLAEAECNAKQIISRLEYMKNKFS